MDISAVYRMELIEKLDKTIWSKYSSYKKVEQYVKLNQTLYDDFGNANFDIVYVNNNIQLLDTLGNIAQSDSELLIKMAIDLGIETPDFIPSIPTFRNKLKDDYKNASTSFEKAFQNIEKNPADAVGNANSVLESIIKEILSDIRFTHISVVSNATSKKLVQEILKVFQLNPDSHELPSQMKSISSSFITVAKAIEDLRSDNTLFHGQDSEKYLISEPLYAYFVVNACATVGLFLIDLYEKKFPKEQTLSDGIEFSDFFNDISDDELPF